MTVVNLSPLGSDMPAWHCRWPLACDNNLTCPGCHPAGTDAGCRYCQARAAADHSDDPRTRLLRRQPPPPPRWYEYSHTATGLEYWLRFLIGEPREFAYVVPRRLACRWLGRHNVTCRGRTDHPRRWGA
ncbi:hypothetical protein ACIGMX_12575 [Streptomyces aquilus]|uniref:hypothetical protein n=1 Tax=Streptomyces aquilus TaxID=2548456 RepID=UPI0037D5B70C